MIAAKFPYFKQVFPGQSTFVVEENKEGFSVIRVLYQENRKNAPLKKTVFYNINSADEADSLKDAAIFAYNKGFLGNSLDKHSFYLDAEGKFSRYLTVNCRSAVNAVKDKLIIEDRGFVSSVFSTFAKKTSRSDERNIRKMQDIAKVLEEVYLAGKADKIAASNPKPNL